jgi:hypothetical protein
LLTLKLGTHRLLAPTPEPCDNKPEVNDGHQGMMHQTSKSQPLLEDEKMAISWKDFKPPRVYHPAFTRISLDDTPSDFSAQKLGKIDGWPNISLYCQKKWQRDHRGEMHKEAVKKVLLQDW